MNLLLKGPVVARKQIHHESSVYFEDHRYVIKLAESLAEIDEALKLRFEVFNIELHEGLDTSYYSLRDEDDYDQQCHHLLVQEKRTGKTIGTYRLQTYEMAVRGLGFYSATEFRLKDLGNPVLKRSVELGRACISRDHRNGRILFLLWKGIAQYVSSMQKRYLFGCSSLSSQNASEGALLLKHLESKGFVCQGKKIHPNPGYWCYDIRSVQGQNDPVRLPPLMDMYFRYGAQIHSYPAIDREFKTIDFLMLLDTMKLGGDTQALFFSKR